MSGYGGGGGGYGGPPGGGGGIAPPSVTYTLHVPDHIVPAILGKGGQAGPEWVLTEGTQYEVGKQGGTGLKFCGTDSGLLWYCQVVREMMEMSGATIKISQKGEYVPVCPTPLLSYT
eukprot:3941397-Rhodomonas_salina.3